MLGLILKKILPIQIVNSNQDLVTLVSFLESLFVPLELLMHIGPLFGVQYPVEMQIVPEFVDYYLLIEWWGEPFDFVLVRPFDVFHQSLNELVLGPLPIKAYILTALDEGHNLLEVLVLELGHRLGILQRFQIVDELGVGVVVVFGGLGDF